MLSMHAGSLYVTRCLREGASGYLTKEGAPEELVTAIQAVLAGKTYLGKNLNESHQADV